MAGQADRLGDHRVQAVEYRAQIHVGAAQQDQELVAAEPADRVAVAYRAAQPSRGDP